MKRTFLTAFVCTGLLACGAPAQTPQNPPFNPGQPIPGQPLPPLPGQPIPGQPIPGQPIPGQPGSPQFQPQRPVRPFVEQMKRHFQAQGPLEKMSPEERMRLRKAMEAVWTAPEVKSARDAAWEATKKYREALRAAVLQADPEIRPLLERLLVDSDQMKPPFGGSANQPMAPNERLRQMQPGDQPRGPRFQPGGQQPGGQPQGPAPQVENPPKPPLAGNPERRPDQSARGEGQPRLPLVEPREIQKLTEEQRAMLRGVPERLEERKDVQEARKAVIEAPPEGKREAFQRFRRTVFAAIKELNPELAKALEAARAELGKEGPRDGNRNPRGENPPVQPQDPPKPAPQDPAAPGAPEDKPPGDPNGKP